MNIPKEKLISDDILIRGILEGLDDSIKVLDLNGVIIQHNKRHSLASKKPLVGQKWIELWPESERFFLESEFKKALNGEKTQFESRRLDNRDALRWWDIKLSPIFSEEESIKNILVIGHDITEIRTSSQALIDSELRLSLATDSAEIGIWDWDLESGTCVFSDTQLNILGFSKEKEVMGIDEFYDYIHPDDRMKVNNEIRKSIQTYNKYQCNFRFIKENNDVIWLKGIGQIIRNIDGQVQRMIGVNIDITEQKQTLLDLKQAKFDANSAFRAKSDFVANISHEIRTPMNSILGYADLLTRKNVSDHLRLDFAHQIQKSGEHLLNLLNDVLDISKIEAGKLDININEINLAQAITDVVNSLSIVALRKGIKLKLEILDEFPEVLCSDDLRIRQILINLIGNAIKFTKVGSVNVALRFEKQTNTQGRVIIDIKDTGIGMDQSSASKLFEPFTQSDASISRKFGGTGLGLHLSKKLAMHLKGDIRLESSEVNKGSHFSFSFPVNFKENVKLIKALSILESKEAAFTEQYSLPNKKLKILLVEDSLENQRLIKVFLSAIDAEIDIAENGQEGITYALSKDYDLIFMDIMMPVMDGLSATKKLRDSGYSKPIVALTAHAIRQEVERCLDAGCNAHLSKPVSQNDLLKTVELYS